MSKVSQMSKIRLWITSFESKAVEIAAKAVVEAARATGAVITSGPQPLPTKIHKFTVLKSPNGDKDARDQFEERTHCRLIEMIPMDQTVDNFNSLLLSPAVKVEMEVISDGK
jgi:small subunit ribosomal protein S10